MSYLMTTSGLYDKDDLHHDKKGFLINVRS